MRILVAGAAGQLGRALLSAPFPAGWAVMGAGRDSFDITCPDQVARVLAEEGCALVVNAAAYTAVDRAESEPDAAFAINRDGAATLAAACAERGVPLIHLSTDYVFDGTSPDPYCEDDAVAPLSVYGVSKAAGEQAVRETLAAHVILRVSWLYGAERRNFVRSIATAVRQGRALRVVDDQIGALTHVDDVAAAIVATAQRSVAGTMEWGTYHFATRGAASWHGVAVQVLALMAEWGYNRVLIEAVDSAVNPLPARRPANSRLDCTKFDRMVGAPRPDWREKLAPTLRQILDVMGEGA